MSIGHRFFLTVSVPVLICLFCLSALLYNISRQELEKEYENRLVAQAEHIRILIADAIELSKSDLSILLSNRLPEQYFMYGDAGELDYQEDVRATLEENFLSAAKVKPQYASLRLFTLDGDGIVNINEQKSEYTYPDPRETEWFNMASNLKKNEIYVSHVHPCPEHQLPSIYVCMLVYYWDKPQAIASLHFHTYDYFFPILKEVELSQNGQAFLVGENGQVIVSSDPAMLAQNGGEVEIIQNILEGREKIHIGNELNGSLPAKEVYFSLNIKNAVGLILQPLAEIEAVSNKLKHRLIGLTTLTFFVLGTVIYLSSTSVSRPLAKLEQTTKIIAGGDLEARVGITRKDEIGSLSTSFDIMTVNLQKSQNDLKQALAEVKKLSGFLPICSNCKKVRDDSGYWNQIESYIRKHSEAEFSHSICPDCAKKIYPNLVDENGNFKPH